MSAKPVIAVLGAGSWGTALAHLVAGKGTTRLWARDQETAQHLTARGENVKYLPGVTLQGIEICADLQAAVADAAWIVCAVPCSGVSVLGRTLHDLAPLHAILVSGTKGLHPENGLRASQLWHDEGWPSERYVCLSGPNLAREIAQGVPTSSVAASTDADAARRAQELFGTPSFRVYTNTDLIGVELGGALKNVVAIAAGMGDGLGFGDNAKAALMTRAWREMTRLAIALGAKQETLFGLSGIGDLFATCASPHSRNRTLGCFLAGGESLQQAQRDVAQVAEGVHTTRAALQLARQTGVELPVTEQVAAVLFEGRDPRRAVEALMSRQERDEVG